MVGTSGQVVDLILTIGLLFGNILQRTYLRGNRACFGVQLTELTGQDVGLYTTIVLLVWGMSHASVA